MKNLIILFCLIGTFCLSACGQSGDLYLPEKTTEPQQTRAS